MGFTDWIAKMMGEEEPEPTFTAPAPPTEEQILAALDDVVAMAKGAQAPPMVQSRLARVANTVRLTMPRLRNLGLGSPEAYSVMATATDYLPEALGGYLRLPREWADTRPIDQGKTSLLLLIDQLDLLGSTMDKVFDAVNRADAQALIAHGRFLQSKFGTSTAGGSLTMDAAAQQQAPIPAAPATTPNAPTTPERPRSSLDLEN